MPNYHVQGGLLFARPLVYLLRGFFAESSRWDQDEFCVYAFVQPLFVPKDGLVFSLGGRLGAILGKQEKWWALTDANEPAVMSEVSRHVQREGPIVLKQFTTLRDVADRAVRIDKNLHNLYSPEMAAYAAVLIDDKKTARHMFECAEDRFLMDNDHREWVLALMERIRHIRAVFERSPAEAKTILNGWREETAAKLKLTKYLAPLPEHPK